MMFKSYVLDEEDTCTVSLLAKDTSSPRSCQIIEAIVTARGDASDVISSISNSVTSEGTLPQVSSR